jgi:hypothetical protein
MATIRKWAHLSLAAALSLSLHSTPYASSPGQVKSKYWACRSVGAVCGGLRVSSAWIASGSLESDAVRAWTNHHAGPQFDWTVKLLV